MKRIKLSTILTVLALLSPLGSISPAKALPPGVPNQQSLYKSQVFNIWINLLKLGTLSIVYVVVVALIFPLRGNALEVCNDANVDINVLLLRSQSYNDPDVNTIYHLYNLFGWYKVGKGQCRSGLPAAGMMRASASNGLNTGHMSKANLRRSACIKNQAYNVNGERVSENLVFYGNSSKVNRQCPDGYYWGDFITLDSANKQGKVVVIGNADGYLSRRVQYDKRSQFFNDETFSLYLYWCVYHEGVRVWDSSLPGRMRSANQVRSECLAKQSHNADAKLQLTIADDQTIITTMEWVSRTIENDDFHAHFSWAVGKIGIDKVRRYIADNNYEGLRWEYYQVQRHNPDSRNLHAGVSNGYIQQLFRNFF